jgi:hypothetical protein
MINLKNLAVGAGEIEHFAVFASHEEALAHICDHVLTKPEAQYWSVLIREYRNIVDPTDDSNLDTVADAFWRGEQRDNAQKLYDGYAREIGLTLYISTDRQWQWKEIRSGKTKHFGIGSSGVLIVWTGQIVVSAMLEIHAAPSQNRRVSYSDRLNGSRPRKNTWAARNKRKLVNFQPSDNESTRYELFRKSFESVRRKIQRAWKEGRTNEIAPTLPDLPIPTRCEWRTIAEGAAAQFELSESKS